MNLSGTIPFVARILTGDVIITLLRFAMISLISRAMVGDGLGEVLYLYNLAIFSNLFADFGLRTSLFIHAAQPGFLNRPQDIGRYAGYRTVFGVVAALVFFVVALGQNGDPGSVRDITALALMALFSAIPAAGDLHIQILKGLKHNRLEVNIRLIEALITVALIALVCLVFSPDLLLIAISFLIPALWRLAYGRRRFRHLTGLSAPKRFDRLRATFTANFETGLSYFFSNFLMRAPVLLIPYLAHEISIPVIALSFMLVQASQILSTSLSHILLPRIRHMVDPETGTVTRKFMWVPFGFLALGVLCIAPVLLIGHWSEYIFRVDLESPAFYQLVLLIPIYFLIDLGRYIAVILQTTGFYLRAQIYVSLFYIIGLISNWFWGYDDFYIPIYCLSQVILTILIYRKLRV